MERKYMVNDKRHSSKMSTPYQLYMIQIKINRIYKCQHNTGVHCTFLIINTTRSITTTVHESSNLTWLQLNICVVILCLTVPDASHYFGFGKMSFVPAALAIPSPVFWPSDQGIKITFVFDQPMPQPALTIALTTAHLLQLRLLCFQPTPLLCGRDNACCVLGLMMLCMYLHVYCVRLNDVTTIPSKHLQWLCINVSLSDIATIIYLRCRVMLCTLYNPVQWRIMIIAT